MFEYRRLKGRIIEVFGTQGKFAEHLGISNVTVSNKLRGITQFSQEDMIQWCNALGIDYGDIGQFFFR